VGTVGILREREGRTLSAGKEARGWRVVVPAVPVQGVHIAVMALSILAKNVTARLSMGRRAPILHTTKAHSNAMQRAISIPPDAATTSAPGHQVRKNARQAIQYMFVANTMQMSVSSGARRNNAQ